MNGGTKDILTVEEAAELFGVRPSTIRRWVEQRRMPFFHLGRLVRFRRESLLEWAAELERETASSGGGGKAPRGRRKRAA